MPPPNPVSSPRNSHGDGAGADPILRLRNVALSHAQRSGEGACATVNWEVWPGDYWLVGALPGSGKSRLLAVAAGLEHPDQGEVSYRGKPYTSLSADALQQTRTRVGMVFEHGGRLFRELTIEENLLTPLRYHFGPKGGGGADWVGTVLSKSGLERLKDRRPAGMGVAYSQRAALARALVLRPEVLLLDNPLALLESSQAHWWIEFLNELSRGADWLDGRPLTLAITTDDLRPWRQQQSGLSLALLGPSRWEVYSSGVPWSNPEDRLMQELLVANLQPRQSAPREASA
ncbi:MAG TPA: ATP-binding cassette domain-containing protein [Methylomirabilota bacterium]|nr:ATP-binding cassette domain-containing protein [Methylomirabilota bacterium]